MPTLGVVEHLDVVEHLAPGWILFEPTMTYTCEQDLKYEVARELCNTRIAQCSARIGEEEGKPVPDAALIEAIRQELFAIGREQSGLMRAGVAAVAASIHWHRVALARQQARYWPGKGCSNA